MKKLFRGDVTIELTDSKGRRETVHGHNMVTNALADFYKTAGMTNPSAFNDTVRAGAVNSLLGGILLFDTALQESADLVRVPSGVKMIGNGARGILNSGSPPELGSWNARESGEQLDGSIKLVWDFNNDQANGTIAAVSLTSLFGGHSGLGNDSGESQEIAARMDQYNAITQRTRPSGMVVGYTRDEVLTVPTIFGVTEWEVSVWANPTREIDIRDNMQPRLKETKTVQIPSAIQNLGTPYSDTNHLITAAHQSGNVYSWLILGSTYNYSSYEHTKYFSDQYPAILIRYNTTTDVVTATILSPTTTGATGWTKTSPVSIGISSNYAIIDSYIINVNNIVDVEDNQDAGGGHAWGFYSDDIFTDSTTILDAAGNTVRPLNYNINGNYTDGAYEVLPLLEANPAYVWRDPRYLATIYNLQTPVVKSADKAMKVSYVLRFGS